MGRCASLLSHAQTVFHLLGKSTFAEQRTEGETLCVFHLLGQLTVTIKVQPTARGLAAWKKVHKVTQISSTLHYAAEFFLSFIS